MIESTILLQESWHALRRRVEDRLEEYVDRGPDCPDVLRDSMAYSLLAGGKRMRPILVLLACQACGGDPETAIPAACAIEMVHTYSLIHDDLPAMDDDDLRRGRPTNHVRFGDGQAVLAGDALLTLAFEILAKDIHPAEVAAACCADLASAAGPEGMVGGQTADLEAEQTGVTTLEELEAIHLRKTGRLLCAALRLGARIAGANDQDLTMLTRYGDCVGLAFQIADDLLDMVGDEGKMGKAVRKDAGHGKSTYPSLLGEQESRRTARRLIDQACEAVAPFGERGHRLQALARFVLERDH